MVLTRHLLNIFVWKDINETTIFCIKTLSYFLLVLEVLVCLVGNYMNSVTVTGGYRRVQWDRNTWLHDSFFGGTGRIAQPVSSLTSICIVFCIVVHVMKGQVLRRNHQRCVLCREFMFQVGVMFKLTLTTEPNWMTDMQADLDMLVLY
jgi:hypothetical protein